MINLLASIKTHYEDMTNREKRIADFLTKNNFGKIFTITELAEKCDVSEASIFRFAKTIGYKGYPKLKIAIANQEYHSYSLNMNKDDSMSTLFSKVCDDVLSSLGKTKNLLKEEALNKTVELIMGSKSIYLFGVANSGNICGDFEHKLFRLGFNARSLTDSHMQIIAASQITKKQLIIAVSHSGRTKDILESTKLAKENGASVVVMTAYADSPLAAMGDVVLLTKSDETNYRMLGLSSRYALLAIIDTIYSYIAIHSENKNQVSQKIEEDIAIKRIESKKKKSSR
jgi:DNA-binding MurR/RpiR family transcriptional regulator